MDCDTAGDATSGRLANQSRRAAPEWPAGAAAGDAESGIASESGRAAPASGQQRVVGAASRRAEGPGASPNPQGRGFTRTEGFGATASDARCTSVTPRTIAIYGPAGAGKSTIGALVAERLGYLFLDTGAMYRAIAFAALRNGVDPDDAERLAALARESRITIGPPTVRDGRAYTVLLGGADVTWEIRSAEIDRIVSQVARVPAVREAMVEQQRALAGRGRVVMVGRDIGTNVLTDAECKIFLTASAAERAKRREEELRSRGQVRPRQELLQEILRRDRMDSERTVAPLRTADDAVVVQTDGLSVGQALDKVLAIVTRPAPTA